MGGARESNPTAVRVREYGGPAMLVDMSRGGYGGGGRWLPKAVPSARALAFEGTSHVGGRGMVGWRGGSDGSMEGGGRGGRGEGGEGKVVGGGGRVGGGGGFVAG